MRLLLGSSQFQHMLASEYNYGASKLVVDNSKLSVYYRNAYCIKEESYLDYLQDVRLL